jgi:hypothetical protein
VFCFLFSVLSFVFSVSPNAGGVDANGACSYTKGTIMFASITLNAAALAQAALNGKTLGQALLFVAVWSLVLYLATWKRPQR